MKILVVGGTGFIARHLCERLHAEGVRGATISYNPSRSFLNVYAPSIQGLEIGSGEARDAFARAEVIVHLAHRSRPSSHLQGPQPEIETNVASAAGLFREILDINPQCHLVYVSSGGQVYGNGHDKPIPENASIAPITPYGLGKLLIEQVLDFFSRTRGASTTILRVANPVGRWQLDRAHGLVSAAVRAARSGETLTLFGDGGNSRDYFDADELAAFLASFADVSQRKTGVYNVGSGRGMTELDVVETVEHVLGRRISIGYAPARPFDLRYAVLDITKARNDLGWRPVVEIEESILKLNRALE